MSSSDDSPAVPIPAFDGDGFLGYDPRLSAHRFAQSESAKDPVADDDSPFFFTSVPVQYTPPPPPINVSGSDGGLSADPVEFSAFSSGAIEKPFEDGFVASSGPILLPEMPEGGFVLREWMRQNAIRLEQKDKNEKELLSQIIDEANEYKDEFYKKRQFSLETNKGICREKEKLFLSSHKKFHAEADKHYWETIAELVLNEVPTIEKKKNKVQQKKHTIAVIQGPKPGKPADLSRMQEILLKLKHNTPPHLNLSPPPAPATAAATKGGNTDAATPGAAVAISPQPVAVA